MNRELPQPGERWRHFKGGEYVIIAIAHNISSDKKYVVYSKTEHNQGNWSDYVRVFDVDSSDIFWMKRAGSNPEFTMYLLRPSQEQWQESDKTESTLWGRRIGDFMGVASSPYGELASNYYRFERITAQPIRISL